MCNFIRNALSDKYLKDKNLSLGAKGILTLLLTTNKDNIDINSYCSDDENSIRNILSELSKAKYIKFDPNLNILDAYPAPYDKYYEKELER